jgi:hypothetical protein
MLKQLIANVAITCGYFKSPSYTSFMRERYDVDLDPDLQELFEFYYKIGSEQKKMIN